MDVGVLQQLFLAVSFLFTSTNAWRTYIVATEILQNQALETNFELLFNNCRYGEIIPVFNYGLCFDFCTENEDCVSLTVLDDYLSCRLCIAANESDVQHLDVDLERTYVVEEELHEVYNKCRRASCLHGRVCENDYPNYRCHCTNFRAGPNCQRDARTCKELQESGVTHDGVYALDPDGNGSFDVYCELNPSRADGTMEAGWTVFQRRIDDSVNFYRDWNEYEAGFGDINENYWMGLENLHRLVVAGPVQLHVYLETFENEWAYALYNQFSIAGAEDFYRLAVAGYSGSAGDAFVERGNGMAFSTRDNDNDIDGLISCAQSYVGSWWYAACLHSNLNGEYLHGDGVAAGRGIVWAPHRGLYYSHKTSIMKIR